LSIYFEKSVASRFYTKKILHALNKNIVYHFSLLFVLVASASKQLQLKENSTHHAINANAVISIITSEKCAQTGGRRSLAP
jgi:hypothetical protein